MEKHKAPSAPDLSGAQESLTERQKALLDRLEDLSSDDLPGLAQWLRDLWPNTWAEDPRFIRRYATHILDVYHRHSFAPDMAFKREAEGGQDIATIVRILDKVKSLT